MTDLIFHQLFESSSCTYSYLLADPQTKEGILIDPVLKTLERDISLINELEIHLKYVLDTHIHADHITSAGKIRELTGAQSAVSQGARVDCADILLSDNQNLSFGALKLKALSTPGHTDSCMSFLVANMLFTGDCLLIRGTGRTDFQQGDSEKLFQSIRENLFKLPEETIIYPGHDYKGLSSSTIAMEKKHNPRIKEDISLEKFKEIMANLKLANPRRIHEALPANMSCGFVKTLDAKENQEGIMEVIPQELLTKYQNMKLIDVREPHEYDACRIPGTELLPLGQIEDLLNKVGNRSQEIVFVCRTGRRSGIAAQTAKEMGYKFTYNLIGGVVKWKELGFPCEEGS